MNPSISTSTLDFLRWVSARPRTYGEAMDAWRTSCPRLSAWEDALAGGLIEFENGGGRRGEARVMLTPRGQAAVAAGQASE